jgi:hypothetical protein
VNDAVNPYATPKSSVDDVGTGVPSEAEALRQEHLKHEASLKAVGLLYLIGGILNLVSGLFMLAAGAVGGDAKGRATASSCCRCFFSSWPAWPSGRARDCAG